MNPQDDSRELELDPPAVYGKVPAHMFEPLNTERIKDEVFQTQPISFFQDALQRFVKSGVSVAAFWIILVVILLAIFAPNFNNYGFNDQDINRINMPPRIQGLENLGVADGSYLLENRRLDMIDDPEMYPEGCILELRNLRTVFGVETADILVNYYIYSGAEDEYFWFGTDYLGRDLFTRMFRGARVSLFIAIVSVAANIIIGVVYGAIAGYFGGTIDLIMMRICEILNSIPFIVVMI
ncbi:MAG: hypothetical protein FWE76_04580, partial [Symbiobacteriaceae bacterium]|nr:hypothetical protein [Symbiobacteriaceae bacterium]